MAKFTNNAAGPRGVNLENGGTVWLEPGESQDIKGAAKDQHPDFDLKAAADDGAEKPLAKMNKTELLAAAAAEGIETVSVDDKDVPVADATNPQLVAVIEAKRAE